MLEVSVNFVSRRRYMLQSSVMVYSKSTKHKLVRDARAGLWVRKPVKQTQRFQSMASEPGSISPLNQQINCPSCGRSVPVNWEGTNWTILRTPNALWLIYTHVRYPFDRDSHLDWRGTTLRHILRLQRNPAKVFGLKVHVYFHISGYLLFVSN